MASNINYFIESNSAGGYVDFYTSNFKGVNVLKFENYPEMLMNEICESVFKRAKDEDVGLEILHNSIDNSIGGILNPTNKRAIFNVLPYCRNKELVHGELKDCNRGKLLLNMDRAYNHFAKALLIHDDWEKIYISNIDFVKLNLLTYNVIDELFGEIKNSKPEKGINKDRFFGAATVDGALDYIPNIIEKLEKRYYIKGRPGTGKSTFLKKIRSYANEQGYDTCTYHCAFDPESLDMVTIPQLSVCFFDSTAPHEHFPKREDDMVIDIYAQAVKEGTDEQYFGELNDLQEKYEKEIANATEYLKKAHECLKKSQKEELNIIDEMDIESDREKAIKHLFAD